MTSHRPRIGRPNEKGVTLIELLLVVAILGVVGAALTGVFSIGLHVLGPGGPQARLAGDSSLMSIEQELGRDAARASCVEVSGSSYPSPGCSSGYQKMASMCSSSVLCFAWPQVSDLSCHVVMYTTGSSTNATRTEFVVSAGGTISSGPANPLAPSQPVSLTVVSGSVQTVVPPSGGSWIRAFSVALAESATSGVLNPPAQTLSVHPLVGDPGSATGKITNSGTPPC